MVSDKLKNLICAIQNSKGKYRQQLMDELVSSHIDIERLRAFLMVLIARKGVKALFEADDVLNETWLAVDKSINGLKSPQSFRSWLNGIAHKTFVTQIRRATTKVRVARNDPGLDDMASEPSDPTDSIDEFVGEEELKRQAFAHRILQDLNRDDCVTVEHLSQGRPARELAEALSVSVRWAHEKMQQLKDVLRRRYGAEYRRHFGG